MDTRTLSRYTFFTFLFLLPFQTVFFLREPFIDGEKWQYGVIAIYGTDILLMLAIVFAVIVIRQPVEKQSRGKNGEWRMANGENKNWKRIFSGLPRSLRSLAMTDRTLLVFLLWAGLSIFWASDQVLAGYFFAKLLLGAGVFFSARSLDDTDVRTAIRILLAAAILQAAIATGQFLWQTSPTSTLLGMSAHDAWQAGTSVLKNETGRWLRAYGSFPHPNMLGGFLAIALVIAIADFRFQIADLKKRGDSAFCILHSAFLILILLGLILTFSRTAWLGAVIGIAAYYAIGYVTGKRHGPMLYRPLLILGVAMAVFVFVLRDQVFPRFDTAIIEREGSVSERMVSLEDAKTLIREHPFLGTGAGNFTAALIGNGSGRPIWSVQPAHNVFVLVLAELGIMGLILFAVFLFVIPAKAGIQAVRNFWIPGQARDDREKGLILKNQNVIFTVAFLTIVSSLFLDHWLWTSHFGIFLLFLLAGFAVRK